ncbi:hypothetical protein [Chroococcidiopsis sp.]|uniref:hypothetical protein n=1 Tax=Chroococcidiopsis sp. TaxID=3088168 RepID=UPI003F2A1F07
MIELELKSIPSDRTADLLAIHYTLADTQIHKNHYFSPGTSLSLNVLNTIAMSHLPSDRIDQLESVVESLAEACVRKLPISIRTRSLISIHEPPRTLLIAKWSLNDESSENGSIRQEIELPVLLQIDSLDSILERDLAIQSKWRRSRAVYLPPFEGAETVCVDHNSGYGPIVEIEAILSDEATAEDKTLALKILRAQLDLLECRELSDDRLCEMFAVYSANWELFYPDCKTFADFPEFRYLMN